MNTETDELRALGRSRYSGSFHEVVPLRGVRVPMCSGPTGFTFRSTESAKEGFCRLIGNEFVALCHSISGLWRNRHFLIGKQHQGGEGASVKAQSSRGEALKPLDVMGID